MSQDESERKIRELIELLHGLSAGCAEEIHEETRNSLNEFMGEVFEDCTDDDNTIDLCDMAYMLANGLAFVLRQLVDGPEVCEECAAKQKNSSKMVH
jgi:hypothetical protein